MNSQNQPNDGQVRRDPQPDRKVTTRRVSPTRTDDEMLPLGRSRNHESEEQARLPTESPSKISHRIDGVQGDHRRAVLKSVDGKKLDLESVPHSIADLKTMEEGPEKESILRAVFNLMQENHYSSVQPEERFSHGCIYHIPKTREELMQRLHDAKMFLVAVRNSDSKLLGFTEFTSGKRVPKLKNKGRIHHAVPTRLQVVMSIAQSAQASGTEKILHEQLIVADQKSRVKGVGKKLLDTAFKLAAARGILLITTEVQVVPPNNRSQKFHAEVVGYKDIGTTTERTEHGDVSFSLYALPLTEEIADKFHGDTPSPTPTVEGS